MRKHADVATRITEVDILN